MAVDMDLVADIRAGTVVRHTLMTISNDQATIRAWSGRGEITVDGVVYGDTGDDLIAISGLSDTATLQSHEIEVSISIGAGRKLGLVGFEARNADIKITTIFMANDGSARSFRKLSFHGSIQSSRATASIDGITTTYKARPPLFDLSRDRMTRYTPPDQYRRFGSSDTGFDDVPDLVNKEPVEWSPGAAAAGGVINVEWSISGGEVVLTDTSGRSVELVGTSDPMICIECGATDRLGLVDGNVTTALARGFHRNPNPRYSQEDMPATEYVQFGYGSAQEIIGNNTVNGGNTWLLDFIGVELNVDGFLYADGVKAVVSTSNSRVYSHDGALLVQMKATYVNGEILFVSPPFSSPEPATAMCSDVDQTFDGTNASMTEIWASFDVNQYLQAQVS